MQNFFNGADAAEAAALNQTASGLNIIVKEILSLPENVERYTEILNDDGLYPFDKEVRLVSMAMEENPRLENYSMHQVRAALSRRLNTMSRTIAERHGFTSYLRFANGKVKKGQLQLEKK